MQACPVISDGFWTVFSVVSGEVKYKISFFGPFGQNDADSYRQGETHWNDHCWAGTAKLALGRVGFKKFLIN
jgi:hypothetical protein